MSSTALRILRHGSLNTFTLTAPYSTVRLLASDDAGRPVLRDLPFRRRQCVFIAFDILYLNGKDLRTLPLIERKAMLKKLLRSKRPRILYLDHVEGNGRLLFKQIVAMDLEGIVCKRKDSPYRVTEKPSRYWIKVKNSGYSQLAEREELFNGI